jgi:hypothetical protein
MPRTIKVAHATCPALDWLVLFCQTFRATEGKPVLTYDLMRKAVENGMDRPSQDPDRVVAILKQFEITVQQGNDLHFPRGNEKGEHHEPLFIATQPNPAALDGRNYVHGQTYAMAGLRCYVLGEIGTTAEVPEELLP